MKISILLLILLCSACSKTMTKSVDDNSAPETIITGYRADFDRYSETVDVMVAFLWPESVTTSSQRQALKDVIRHSRELRVKKDEYLAKKLVLKKKYQKHYCDCALNSECTGAEGELDQNLCYELEEAVYAHDRILPEIMKLVDIIKTDVATSGGEWLDTHTDFIEEPASRLNFQDRTFFIGSLGSFTKDDKKSPLPYEVKNFELIEESDFLRLTFTQTRVDKYGGQQMGTWRADVAVKAGEAALLFQGDLFWDYQGKERKGVIYWENALKEIK